MFNTGNISWYNRIIFSYLIIIQLLPSIYRSDITLNCNKLKWFPDNISFKVTTPIYRDGKILESISLVNWNIYFILFIFIYLFIYFITKNKKVWATFGCPPPHTQGRAGRRAFDPISFWPCKEGHQTSLLLPNGSSVIPRSQVFQKGVIYKA